MKRQQRSKKTTGKASTAKTKDGSTKSAVNKDGKIDGKNSTKDEPMQSKLTL